MEQRNGTSDNAVDDDSSSHSEDSFPTDYQIVSQRNNINVAFYHSAVQPDVADKIFRNLERKIQWITTPTKHKRCTQMYGDANIGYQVTYKEKTSTRVAQPWSSVSCLLSLKTIAEVLTGEKYNMCVVQRYPSGKVGIGAHKDKEMIKGTTICGFSFGETRQLVLRPPKYLTVEPITISLTPGSLYVLKPNTNTYWTHEITKQPELTSVRISLTFRNYPV